MALGPASISSRRAAAMSEAERLIDAAIGAAGSARVTVATKPLGITPVEWETVLKPKYRAAGWKVAAWNYDQRDGDYLDLRSD